MKEKKESDKERESKRFMITTNKGHRKDLQPTQRIALWKWRRHPQVRLLHRAWPLVGV